MRIQVQELDPCRRQLVVEAPPEEVQAAWDAAYGQVQRAARLPGFRPGRVPRALVRRHFAAEVRRTVAERFVPEACRRALAEAQLHPVDEPEVRELVLEEGQPARLTAVVEVRPSIALGAYRGVRARYRPVRVTAEDLEAALRALAERHASLNTVARPARVGDHVVVDYVLEPEGEPARREEGFAFEVGAGRVLAELEEGVMGLAPGEERQVAVRFPADHPREALRGRPGRLWFRLLEVKEREVPAVDEELARAVGAPSLEALRETVRAQLEAEAERRNRRARGEAVVDALLAAHAFAVPERLVEREVGRALGMVGAELARRGIDPERVPWDRAGVTADLRPAAEREVRRTLLLEAIAEREEITVSEAEVDAEIERLAREAGRAPQAMRSWLQRQGELEGLRQGLRMAKTLAFLVEHAHIETEE